MTVFVNKSGKDIRLKWKTDLKPVRMVYPENSTLKGSKTLFIPSEATLVIEWQ